MIIYAFIFAMLAVAVWLALVLGTAEEHRGPAPWVDRRRRL